MMRFEQREKDPNVNLMLRSGAATGEDKGKLTEEGLGVCKTPTKKPEFNLECAKKTFMEAKKSFAEVSSSSGKDQPEPEIDPSMLSTFLETCMKLLPENKTVKGLQELITRCARSGEPLVVWKLGKYALHIGQEMRLTTQIDDYEMDQIILDLGSDENVLPKKTWERMSRPTLQWYPIQLWMVNQQKIFPMGRLQGVTVDIEGASMQIDFEVIEIVDDSNPYLVLLGIDWAIDMNGVIDLKKLKMIFEKKSLCIVILLDPAKGARYIELVRDDEIDDDLDHIYKIIA